jgi:hypothetical protein
LAQLNKTALFIPSGKLGDVVIKTLRGKSYLSLKPSRYKPPDDQYYRDRLSAFSFSTSFCSALNKLKIFKELWRSTERSSFSNMMSQNLRKARKGAEFKDMELSPFEGNFQADVKEYSLSEDILRIVVNPLSLSWVRNKWLSLQGVMMLRNPSDENQKPVRFLPLFSGYVSYLPQQELTFEIKFTGGEIPLLRQYPEKEVLINLAAWNKERELRGVSINRSFPV